MFVTKTKIAAAIMLLALLGSGVCLTRYSSGQSAPIEPPPPAKPAEKDARNDDANKPVEKSPLGLVHDFGKVPRGTQLRHTFRIINTSDVPLRILSARTSSGALNGRSTKDVLQPGEEGTLEVSLDSRRFSGPKTCVLWLTTANGKVPVTTDFYIKADSQ